MQGWRISKWKRVTELVSTTNFFYETNGHQSTCNENIRRRELIINSEPTVTSMVPCIAHHLFCDPTVSNSGPNYCFQFILMDLACDSPSLITHHSHYSQINFFNDLLIPKSTSWQRQEHPSGMLNLYTLIMDCFCYPCHHKALTQVKLQHLLNKFNTQLIHNSII